MIRKKEYATDAATDIPDSSDADLVRQSLSGNREAFGRIVVRYQTLICSLTYSGTGSLGQSEDLAQETFLAAFQQLAGLREPQKLRSWLCGIARNLMNNTRKQQGREPTHAAQPIDALHESLAPEGGAWDYVNAYGSNMALADMPLSVEQSARLAGAIANACPAFQEGKSVDMQTARTVDWAAVDAAAVNFLTPEQMIFFRTIAPSGATLDGPQPRQWLEWVNTLKKFEP